MAGEEEASASGEEGGFDTESDDQFYTPPTSPREECASNDSLSVRVSHGSDIVQALEVSIAEIYCRDVKKIQFVRYAYDRSKNTMRSFTNTVLVPVEHHNVRFAGLGDQRASDAAPGDAVFEMTVVNRDGAPYSRDGYDLRATIEVSPYELCFGGRRALPHPSGGEETIVLEIGKNFFERVDATVRVPRHGLYNPTRDTRHDLYLTFRVCTTLDAWQERALRRVFRHAPPSVPGGGVSATVHA